MDAAESLLIECGFAAMSLRAIAETAGVNLAATHYHFGSKFGLLAAIFHRQVSPIDLARAMALDKLLERDSPPQVHEVLRAFVEPLSKLGNQDKLPRIIGCILAEPEAVIRPLLQQEFGVVVQGYEALLHALSPHLSAEDIRWRFHFFVGGMLHVLRFNRPLGQPEASGSLVHGLGQLVDFAAAGFAVKEVLN